MRYFTHNVSAHLVRELDIAGAVKHILHDGGDIIHLELITGQSLMIYLIESPIPLYEIRNIVKHNTLRGDHTLFILWSAFLLPDEGRTVQIKDWHEALMRLYGDMIYAYNIHHYEVYVYPVFFDRVRDHNGMMTGQAKIRYGEKLDVGAISSHEVQARLNGETGWWRIAAFNGDPDYFHRQQAREMVLPTESVLQTYYRLLNVDADADLHVVKRAYRTLARRYHPDMNNDDPGATQQMQALNHAYNAILKSREAE